MGKSKKKFLTVKGLKKALKKEKRKRESEKHANSFAFKSLETTTKKIVELQEENANLEESCERFAEVIFKTREMIEGLSDIVNSPEETRENHSEEELRFFELIMHLSKEVAPKLGGLHVVDYSVSLAWIYHELMKGVNNETIDLDDYGVCDECVSDIIKLFNLITVQMNEDDVINEYKRLIDSDDNVFKCEVRSGLTKFVCFIEMLENEVGKDN